MRTTLFARTVANGRSAAPPVPTTNSRMPVALATPVEVCGAELVINGHDHDYERFAPAACSTFHNGRTDALFPC